MNTIQEALRMLRNEKEEKSNKKLNESYQGLGTKSFIKEVIRDYIKDCLADGDEIPDEDDILDYMVDEEDRVIIPHEYCKDFDNVRDDEVMNFYNSINLEGIIKEVLAEFNTNEEMDFTDSDEDSDDYDFDDDVDEYMEEAEKFADKIKTSMSVEEAKKLYYDDYNFAEHAPGDAAEELICNALKDKINTSDVTEGLNESVSDTLPTHALDRNVIYDYIRNLPLAHGVIKDEEGNVVEKPLPPKPFKLGYMKELKAEIAAKFRLDRKKESEEPVVRIFKCVEYSALYTGVDWKSTNDTKKADKILGTERHTGEKTGFNFQGDDAMANKIGTYKDGSEALQAYIQSNSRQKVKYFMSLNDEDLHEARPEDFAQYLTPASAEKIVNGSPRTAVGVTIDREGNAVNIFDKPINRFKISGIYMIGNLGSSIF